MAKSKSASAVQESPADAAPVATFATPPAEILEAAVLVPDAPVLSPEEVAAQERLKRAPPPEPDVTLHHTAEMSDSLPEWIQDRVKHCNHVLLDQRNGRWVLLVVGGNFSGGELATFPNRDAGVKWIGENSIPGVRIPSLGVG